MLVGGRPVLGPAAERGMLFQSPQLFPWLTTRGNVLFGPRAQRSRGLDRREDDAIEADADGILETVGLASFADAYPHELSGGMRHRAAFARAIMTRPSLLLMDEPFGALDALTRMRMHAFLLEMWERYALTIVFVTHDIEEAIVLGDRVAIMGGRPGGSPRSSTSAWSARARTSTPRRSCTPSGGCAPRWGCEDGRARVRRGARRPARHPSASGGGRTCGASRRGAAGWRLLIAWQLAALVLDDDVILPSATQTAHAFAHTLVHPYPAHSLPLWRDLLISLRRILIGFAAASAIGVAIGAAMFASRPLRHLIDPVIEATRPLPPLAFIPLLIVWFGIGELPKEVLIVVGIVPVMVVATVAGLDAVPEDLQLAARTLGAHARVHAVARPGPRRAADDHHRHADRHGRRLEQHRRGRDAGGDERRRLPDHAGGQLPQHRDRVQRDHHDRADGLALDAALRSLLRVADPSRRG